MVPVAFLADDGPIEALKGTVTLLLDNGFDESEAIDWLLGAEESLGVPPVEALAAGRKAEVRRVAQALA